MAKPNYQYEKRQKEMAKKAKQEEKRRQKLKNAPAEDGSKELLAEKDAAPPADSRGEDSSNAP